ncbi:MAG: Ig-like domain-containing protein, partial [Fibrobacteria bacterium]
MTLWNCNVSDTGETFAINVKLNDSLAVEDSIFKSVTIAIYDGNGNLVQADVFKGEYHKSDAAKLANLPLAAKPPEPFEIRITAYKKNSTDSWVFKTLISNGTPQPLPPVHNTVPESTATVLPTRVLIVNPVSHTLYLADSAISLVAKVEPATAPAAITWSLSNADVAVIGIDGKIRGLMAGTVVLKAASTGTPAVFDTATLTVKPQPTALPASVQISNPHPLLLTEGGASSKLDAVVHPDEASQGIVWTSLAPDVAVIEPGNLIKGLKAGTALVKAASTVTPTVFDTLTVMVSGQVTIAPVSVAITNTNPLLLTVGGGTVKLKANVLPVDASQAVVWTSSATDIAGIDSGNVLKGLKAGTTKVTVASAGNPSISATLDVTVQEAPAVLPTAIIPKAATLALQVGDPAVNLEAAVIPTEASQNVIWSLEAAGAVEIVSNSQLRALKAGTAKVIATSAVKATVTATITVTVTAPIVIPDSISLRMPVPMTLAPNGATSDISWAIVPAAADQSVEWSSSDIAVAQITTDNKVKSVAIGKATITGKSKAKPALTISFQVNVVKPIKVDAITLTPKTLKLYTGGADGQLGVAMTGNDTGAQYSLSSSNALIASVNAAGAVKGVKAGSAVITAAVVGYPAISSVCSVTVITDPPVVTVTPDQTVDYGGEASFSVAVKQDYGTTAEIKADMDGNGTFEKSVLAKDSATFKATYSEAKIFTLNFEVKDSEGNVVALTRKVTVTAVAAPVVKITDPATAITVNT